MAGLCLINLNHTKFLAELATLSSAWLCLALQGKLEAFGELVNEKAKTHRGQSLAARRIRGLLADENYQPKRGQDVSVQSGHTAELIQDRPVIGVHALDLIWGLGTLHCMSQQQPRL